MDDPEAILSDLLASDAWIRSLAAQLVANPDDAQDAAQDAWVAALQEPPHRRGALRAWLGRVVRNLVWMRRRTDAHRKEREEAAARPEPLASVAEAWEKESTRYTVTRAVFSLEEPYRSVIVLRYFENLAPREIALRLGVSPAAVKGRLGRGLQKLRARLDRDFGDRRSWCAALLPLVGNGTTGAGAAAGASSASLLTGALVMSTKIKIGIALVVALGVAYAFWPPDKVKPPEMPRAEVVQPAASVAKKAAKAEPRPQVLQPAPAPRVTPPPDEPQSTVGRRPGVHGRVITLEGRPIAGATVRLLDDGLSSFHQLQRSVLATSQTGVDGSFDFGPRDRALLVEASHPDLFASRKPWSPLRPDGTLEFRLGDGGVITGLAHRGKTGIANVRVRARLSSDGYCTFGTMTGPDGRYRLPALRPGEHWLFVAPPDGPSSSVVRVVEVKVGQATEADLPLPSRVDNRVEGRITDRATRQPLSGVIVIVYPNPNHRTVTDACGRFVLENLGLRRVVLHAVKKGFVLATAVVNVNEQSRIRHDFALTATASVSGRVVDALGRPVPFPHVATREFQLKNARGMVIGDSEGRYAFPAVRPGEDRTVLAEADGFATGRSTRFRLDPGQHMTDVVVVLEKGASLAGRVCAEGGAPVAGARVRIRGELVRFEAVSNSEGAFSFERLSGGRLELTVRADSYVDFSEIITLSLGESLRREIILSRGLTVTGKITRPDGHGVAARLTLRSTKDTRPSLFRAAASSAEDGRFALSALPSGRYCLQVVPEDDDLAPATLPDVIAGTADLLIRLEPAVSIAGSLELPGGEPAPWSFWVLCQRIAQGGTPGEVVGRHLERCDGEFRVDVAREGVYRVMAGAPGGLVSDPVIVQTSAQLGTAHVALELFRGATLRGRVVSRSGEPVVDVQVTLLDSGGFHAVGPATQKVDRNGSFTFCGLPAGRYQVTAAATSEPSRRGSCSTVIASGEAHVIVELREARARGPSRSPRPTGER
jgi:RNA polymerase sigma-70 factor (ECF subfamily)